MGVQNKKKMKNIKDQELFLNQEPITMEISPELCDFAQEFPDYDQNPQEIQRLFDVACNGNIKCNICHEEFRGTGDRRLDSHKCKLPNRTPIALPNWLKRKYPFDTSEDPKCPKNAYKKS